MGVVKGLSIEQKAGRPSAAVIDVATRTVRRDGDTFGTIATDRRCLRLPWAL